MSLARLRDAIALPIVAQPVLPTADLNGDLAWAIKAIKDKINDVYLAERYYTGDHRIGFATEKWRTEFGKIVKSLNANYCPAVVDALTDRLRLGAIIANGASGEKDDGATDAISAAFNRNRFDRRAGAVHAMAAKHGEAYILVWPHPDTAKATFYVHPADRVAIRYDESRPGTILVAAKVWMEGKRCRATLYYPDRVERWATAETSTYSGIPNSAKAFVPFSDESSGPVVFHPYGIVPIVPFLNNAIDGEKGRSELADVIPLQDINNKALADMLIAMEYAGFPQRWATGLSAEENDPVTGKPLYPFVAGVERLFMSDSADTAFGQFQTADLTQFVAVQDSLRSDIARVSRTPLHYLLMSGSFPSGEALYVAEGPLRAKVQDRQDEHGTSWEDVGMLVLLVDGIIRPESMGNVTIAASWKDVASSAPKTIAETAQLHVDLGASEQQGLREAGYTDDQIKQMEAEKVESALTAFDRGEPEAPLIPPPPLPPTPGV